MADGDGHGTPGAPTPRGTVLATVGIVLLFVAAIVGVIAASMHHSGTPTPTATGVGTASSDSSAPATSSGPQSPTAASARPPQTPAAHPTRPTRPAPRMTVLPGRELKPRQIVVIKPTSFVVASFNLLGASHTTGKHARKDYRSGPDRLVGELALLRAKGVTVAGLQEFQPPQVAAFRRLAGDAWSVYPGTTTDNSIVWLNADWTPVVETTHPFPYFHGGTAHDPAVLLRNNDTGRTVWFVNVHSPADVGGMHNAGGRASTVAREAALVKQLGATSTPVILTGDMNDRAHFACSFTALSGMWSSDGWHTANGVCVPGARPQIDWILGTSQVSFSNDVADPASQQQRLSDHPIVTATATIAGSRTPVGLVTPAGG